MHRNMLPGPSALGGEEREGVVTLRPVLMNISGRKVLPRLSASVHGDCYSHALAHTVQMLKGWKMGCRSCSGQLTFFCCNTGFRRKSERIKSPLKSREKLHLEPHSSYLINGKASLSFHVQICIFGLCFCLNRVKKERRSHLFFSAIHLR